MHSHVKKAHDVAHSRRIPFFLLLLISDALGGFFFLCGVFIGLGLESEVVKRLMYI
jgi:hypothetical protein